MDPLDDLVQHQLWDGRVDGHAHERLSALSEWTEEAIEECVRGLAAEKEKGARHLIHPLRFATTGRTVSAGLFETMQLLGRERCLMRIEDVLEKMQRLSSKHLS